MNNGGLLIPSVRYTRNSSSLFCKWKVGLGSVSQQGFHAHNLLNRTFLSSTYKNLWYWDLQLQSNIMEGIYALLCTWIHWYLYNNAIKFSSWIWYFFTLPPYPSLSFSPFPLFISFSGMESQVNLRLLLVDGKSHTFMFEPELSASDICRHVFTNWPAEWEEMVVDRPQALRLIYQGKFLNESVMLCGEFCSTLFCFLCWKVFPFAVLCETGSVEEKKQGKGIKFCSVEIGTC